MLLMATSWKTDVENVSQIKSLHDEKLKEVVLNRRKSIKRRPRYLKHKYIAESNFLSRKKGHRVSGILTECPGIGSVIEKYVEDRNIGADAWRRTGVLTFDGNTQVQKKVTFEHIRHLESYYKRKFSYGTVVQLCIARNKRRKSAARYRGVAKVTCRRAPKGFALKYNPDAHWSSALYRGLNYIQYADGRNVMNVNRDDAAGFRLDTMSTHRLHKIPVVQGKETLTTRTDFVNRYPSLLQTSSYHFAKTATTATVCAGVVKASGLYPKNPAQHAADIEMLEELLQMNPAFTNPITSQRKEIECIRVDGASDEGPSHEEIQFNWTERHYNRGSVATLVSARSSGASYLNRVELQNGCMALAHANLFIPSTLCGANIDSSTGKINQEVFKNNMTAAKDVYISRVDQCSCGETLIHLCKGANSRQEKRKYHMQFLKGTVKQKEVLRKEHRELWDYFEKIWALRKRHMVEGLPSQYLFHLVCCGQPSCCHPVCCSGEKELPQWFPGGPSVKYLPLPVPDPRRPWGNPACSSCGGECFGHYVLPDQALQLKDAKAVVKPPSVVLKEGYLKLKGKEPTKDYIEQMARVTLLSLRDVEMWFDHLKVISDNRKRGAAQAAETRKRNRALQQSKLQQIEPQVGSQQAERQRALAGPPQVGSQQAERQRALAGPPQVGSQQAERQRALAGPPQVGSQQTERQCALAGPPQVGSQQAERQRALAGPPQVGSQQTERQRALAGPPKVGSQQAQLFQARLLFPFC